MRAAPYDQFYPSRCYPNSLPGGLPADAFAGSDADRAGSAAALWRRPLQPVVGPRRPGIGIIRPMTRALDTAIAKLTTLPADEQDRIAQWLLEELWDEQHWARQFAASQSALSKLAAEARAERAAGRATELDPDKL